ncbi:hypothetical protein M885DRAFT_530154 [Pelagophyceae sp. CCMP2097]|nr:hypothetical protein M885DRAFT_530154 [Pelagophyceae sp. CCMP2097]
MAAVEGRDRALEAMHDDETKAAKKWEPPSAFVLIYVSLAFAPRFALCACVFVVGQICRALAKLFCRSVGAAHPANKRVLIVTDYMPPQCHGIATRVQQYTKHLRSKGHEVHVYTCCVESRAQTSFDHATVPYVNNPFNKGNQISYSVGVKLAFALGAESWDVVHVVYPNMLGLFILPCCQWRGIAAYCSHHVDFEYYVNKYVSIPGWPTLQRLAIWGVSTMYHLCYKMPASNWADVNTSMTRCFVESHLPAASQHTRVGTIGSGIDPDIFHTRKAEAPASLLWLWCDPECTDARVALRRRLGAPDAAKVWLMVQRLAPEKETQIAIAALEAHNAKVPPDAAGLAYLAIAGDGPARATLEAFAASLPHARDAVTFLGAVQHGNVPALYRATDLFVTCSRSETFGLTVTEALACGAPVAYPACAVFDELYRERLPRAWRYDGEDEAAAPQRLLRAIEASCTPDAKKWLAANPVDASWASAAADLDEQYADAMKRQQKNAFKTLRDAAQARALHMCRFALFAASTYFVMSWYYRKIACSVAPWAHCAADDVCDNVTCFKPFRIAAACVLILAIEWVHC